MRDSVHEACKWCYSGVWRVLTDWFRVPQQPPTLPSREPSSVQAFRPSENYLRYLKLFFWIACVLIDLVLAALWITIAIAEPIIGAAVTPLMLSVMVIPDVVSYVAIHLKFDTTWYVLSERSMRIRRGIWILRETTITFENVQNVRLTQGPLERYYGFANLIVDTAGGGAAYPDASGNADAHHGIISGITQAEQLRDKIMEKVRECRTAGLGDEQRGLHRDQGTAMFATDVGLLLEIRDETAMLARKL